MAAEAGERIKDSRHEDLVTTSGGLFYPLAVECLGCWTPSSLEIIKTIARKTVISIGSSISRSVTNLQEQLPVRLWQYNAKLICPRLSVEVTDDNFLVV